MKRAVLILFIIMIVLVAIFAFLLDTNKEVQDTQQTDEEIIDQRVQAAFQQEDCPNSSYNIEGTDFYKGILIDTHIHIASISDDPMQTISAEESPVLGENTNIADYVCMMNVEGTAKVFAFFPVWEPIIHEQLQIVNLTLAKYPNRFIPFIMPPDHDDRTDGFPTVDAENLQQMLSQSNGMFQGYGEIGLYARGDHGGPKGAPELPPNSTRLKEIYPIIRENNLLIYVHLGEGQKEAFEQVLSENPEINFIWHGDQLIPYQNDVQNLTDISDILSDHPNAYYGIDELYADTWLLRPEISKQEFISHFSNYSYLLEQDLKTWKGFIEEHPNQVLWGTDRGWSAPWSLDQEVAITLNNYTRTFISYLDPSVQEKFAYKNAEMLLQ